MSSFIFLLTEPVFFFWRDVLLPFRDFIFLSRLLLARGVCVTLPFSLKYHKGVRLDSSQARFFFVRSQFGLFFYSRNSSLTVSVCFGALSGWNILFLPEFWRLGIMLLVYPQTFMLPSINAISPTPFPLKQPVLLHSYLSASRP